jgi:hypothetical protein
MSQPPPLPLNNLLAATSIPPPPTPLPQSSLLSLDGVLVSRSFWSLALSWLGWCPFFFFCFQRSGMLKHRVKSCSLFTLSLLALNLRSLARFAPLPTCLYLVLWILCHQLGEGTEGSIVILFLRWVADQILFTSSVPDQDLDQDKQIFYKIYIEIFIVTITVKHVFWNPYKNVQAAAPKRAKQAWDFLNFFLFFWCQIWPDWIQIRRRIPNPDPDPLT